MELVLPRREHEGAANAFIKACQKTYAELAGHSELGELPYATWLEKIYDHHFNRHVPEGRVPASTFFAIEGGEMVGLINVRHELNTLLREAGGHIGYMVHPNHRRKGYATEMVRQAVDWMRTALHVENVLITCSPGNEGSRKTILKNGGVYENTVDNDVLGTVERYWIT